MDICVDDFVLNLRDTLFKKRMSQAQLAQKINVDQPQVNCYCKGRALPSLWMFCLICDALECEPNELLRARPK